jgi:hypothetical protein
MEKISEMPVMAEQRPMSGYQPTCCTAQLKINHRLQTLGISWLFFGPPVVNTTIENPARY